MAFVVIHGSLAEQDFPTLKRCQLNFGNLAARVLISPDSHDAHVSTSSSLWTRQYDVGVSLILLDFRS
jgi:hypothetical protein